jgi:hypothetical protein
MAYKGHSAPGMGPWGISVGLALFMGLTIRSGAFFLPGGWTIEMRKQPLLFWSLMAILTAILAGGLAAGWYLLMHVPYQ